MASLRSKRIRCVVYLDNMLIMNQSKEFLKEDMAAALGLLEALGFLVNYVKSSLVPAQVLSFLGFVRFQNKKAELTPPCGKLSLPLLVVWRPQLETSLETLERGVTVQSCQDLSI